MEEAPAASQPTKLWDWPIRLIHWSFALLMPALWWTWKYDRLQLHELLGYVTLGLLVFRLYWGFVGSSTARFASFVKGPRAIWAYLRGSGSESVVGHNPIGALSVLILLGLMIAQVVIGLFTQDVDGIESGPLAYLVSYETADAARHWHDLLFDILLGFIVLHLCAIAFYLLVKRDNLVGPMLTGRKRIADAAPTFAPWWRIVVGAAISAGLAYWVSLGCPLPWATA